MGDIENAIDLRIRQCGLSRVVVFEDDHLTKNLMHDVIFDMGFEVCSLSNAEDAVDYLKNKSCDILISDIDMPSMSGFELARWVSNCCSQTRIVLMSAKQVDSAEVQPGWKVFRKPINFAMIQAAVGISSAQA